MTDLVTVEPPAVTSPPPPQRRKGLVARLPFLSDTRNPWIARVALCLFGAGLFIWPSIIDNPTDIRQWAEWLCYAMVAVGLDLAWGYGGMLALGQGLFFGLGAYAMGMHLSLENVPKGALPEFMGLYSDYSSLPAVWQPFRSFWFPPLRGFDPDDHGRPARPARLQAADPRPFFAILTQATAVIFALLLIGNLKLTPGSTASPASPRFSDRTSTTGTPTAGCTRSPRWGCWSSSPWP